MTYTQATQGMTGPLIILIASLSFLILTALYYGIVKPFVETRDYIKREMSYSYDDEEYYFWKNELKRLYIYHIPFIGKLILKFMR